MAGSLNCLGPTSYRQSSACSKGDKYSSNVCTKAGHGEWVYLAFYNIFVGNDSAINNYEAYIKNYIPYISVDFVVGYWICTSKDVRRVTWVF